MTAILGISAYYHDSAAALVVDGRIVAAAQEERFTRKKHDSAFPTNAVEYCLREAGISAADLNYVGFYEKPFLKFDRLLETYLSYAPIGFRSFVRAIPLWLKKKLHLPRELAKELGGAYTRRFVFCEHHESHAASAFLPSPFEHAAVVTLDGVGEWATTTIGEGRGNTVRLLKEIRFPHSLGLLYSAFTLYCGFRVNSGEYKLMGLAPYGEPTYADLIREHLIDLKEDGSFRLNLEYFDYCVGERMISRRFERLFGGPARRPEGAMEQRHMDLAASIQKVTEDVMLRVARHAHALTGAKNLCLAGGVALNCVGNGRILREGPFENVWIQPAAGDAGGALGVAMLIWHQLLGNERRPSGVAGADAQGGSLLGPRFGHEEIRAFLDSKGARYHEYPDDDSLCEAAAELLATENVVGWLQGRMEFGPRALGSRSILGDARSESMQSVMNLKIKYRESFRPFAPAVLAEDVGAYFELDRESPYMLLVADVQPARRRAMSEEEQGLFGIAKLNVPRSDIPAVTHVDYSARIQTVNDRDHRRYRELLEEFRKLTGCSVIVNTSFNVRGEPIVCTPADAYLCFMRTEMDALLLEDCLLHKSEQPPLTGDSDWRSTYGLD